MLLLESIDTPVAIVSGATEPVFIILLVFQGLGVLRRLFNSHSKACWTFDAIEFQRLALTPTREAPRESAVEAKSERISTSVIGLITGFPTVTSGINSIVPKYSVVTTMPEPWFLETSKSYFSSIV